MIDERTDVNIPIRDTVLSSVVTLRNYKKSGICSCALPPIKCDSVQVQFAEIVSGRGSGMNDLVNDVFLH